MVAARLWWRGGAPGRRRRAGGRRRAARRPPAALIARMRAAASSIASGSPSSRRQISATPRVARRRGRKSGRAARARGRRTARRRPRPAAAAPATSCSPSTPSGSRLVASTATPGQCRDQLGDQPRRARPARARSCPARAAAPRRRRYSITVCSIVRPVALLHLQRRGHGVADRAAVGAAGPARTSHAPSGKRSRSRRADLDGQPRLADPADPGQRHQRRPPQRRGDRVDSPPPGRRSRSPAAGRLPGPARSASASAGSCVEYLRGRAPGPASDGSTPSSSSSRRRSCVVGGQRVGLAPARVARAHQQQHGLLPVRVAARPAPPARPPPRRAAQLQQGVDPLLGGGEPQLVQPGGLGRRRIEVGELVERVAPPQGQRRVQQVDGRARGRRRRRAARRRSEPLELGGVELVVGHVERVARAPVAQPQPLRTERGAQPGHVGAQRADAPRGGGSSPHTRRRPAGRSDTTVPGATSSTASRARGFGPPRSTGAPRSSTSSGPRIRNVTADLLACNPDCNPGRRQ